jgi:hypothetical protein
MRSLVILLVAGCRFSAPAGSEDATIDADGSDPDGGGDAAGSDAASADAPAMAQVSYVQGDSGAGASDQTTLALSQPIVAGDLAVLGVGTNGGTIASVTDTAGNTFTSVNALGGATIYVASNMRASASDTITVDFVGNTGFTAGVAVYRGLAATAPVDGVSGAMGAGTALDSGAFSTSHPHDLLVGVALSDGTMAAGSGFTRHVGGTYSMIEDREVTSAGSYHATAGSGGAVNWRICGVALKAAD